MMNNGIAEGTTVEVMAYHLLSHIEAVRATQVVRSGMPGLARLLSRLVRLLDRVVWQ